jgi:hypothetical protein
MPPLASGLEALSIPLAFAGFGNIPIITTGTSLVRLINFKQQYLYN